MAITEGLKKQVQEIMGRVYAAIAPDLASGEEPMGSNELADIILDRSDQEFEKAGLDLTGVHSATLRRWAKEIL